MLYMYIRIRVVIMHQMRQQECVGKVTSLKLSYLGNHPTNFVQTWTADRPHLEPQDPSSAATNGDDSRRNYTLTFYQKSSDLTVTTTAPQDSDCIP